MDEMAERYGERNFLTDNFRRVSYKEFRHEVRHLAKALYKIGVRKDTKVALIMGNQIEWLVIDFAVTLLGGVLVGVNTWWKKMELEHALLCTVSGIHPACNNRIPLMPRGCEQQNYRKFVLDPYLQGPIQSH